MTTINSKPLASLTEAYRTMYYALRNLYTLKRGKDSGALSKNFNSRIMLAVTEVNGCGMCAYGHATMALESGMSETEIAQLLKGEASDTPTEEQAALLFAQHVADNRGLVSKKAWNHLLHLYGEKRAYAILASVQVIMMGNTFGIPIGSLFSRFSNKDSFKKDERTTLSYEVTMFLAVILFLPLTLIQSLLGSLINQPRAKFY